jgi:seryl-tRNA synthetase
MAETIKIGGELESMATGKVVAAASAIKDKSRNKTQEVINGDVEKAIAEQSAQFEALSEETSAAVASASQSARQAEHYLADLQEAIADLPDGQAVSAQVAVNEADISILKRQTSKISETSAKVNDSEDGGTLDITDPNGYVIVRYSDGHIKTKNFDSRDIQSISVEGTKLIIS